MVDILIKSYNRPYYLDRCIESIYQHILHTEFNIVILDDGTPDKYLKKIKGKYPEVEIITSKFYKEKSSDILSKKSNTNQKIPIEMWLNGGKNASNYFLLLEDDVWFVNQFDLQKSINLLDDHNGVFLKLFWLGNKDLRQSFKEQDIDGLVKIDPGIPSYSPKWYRFVFYGFERFKIRWINEKLGFNTLRKRHSFYSIYSVCGVVFRKDYFLSLWNNHENKVDERLQIYNALCFIKEKPTKREYSFFRSKKELIKTGFCSSATDKVFLGENLVMNSLNEILNESWFNDDLDTLENYPKDFSEEYLDEIIKGADCSLSDSWKSWRRNFREKYQSLGCQID